VADDERSRLHQIVDELPDDELVVARQLLELLAKGLATPRGTALPNATDEDEDDDDVADGQLSSPETIAKLAQLSDEELLHLDDLLESDRDGARQFWRQRFGEELPDDELVEDGSG
jgi:hypothetical protein